MGTVRVGAIGIIILIIVSSSNALQAQGIVTSEEALQSGPFIDRVNYRVIQNRDQRILALQTGEIEIDSDIFHLSAIQKFETDPAISVRAVLDERKIRVLKINCSKYPLNISGVRRSFAFAFNKTKIPDETGHPFTIVDSLIPTGHPWCIEQELATHYYEARPDIGNALLDSLDFSINPSTGYRETPEGDPFEIVVMDSWSSDLDKMAIEAFESLHIMTKIAYSGGDIFIGYLYFDSYIKWFTDEYWSQIFYNDQEQNMYKFQNDTFDYWRMQLWNATSEEQAHEAIVRMQEVLHYNVPVLSLYQYNDMMAYRNDRFSGHIEDGVRSVSNSWTLRKIHMIDGTWGGIVPIAINEEPDSFNHYQNDFIYSDIFLPELVPTLYDVGPDLKPVPDLVENIITETHSDNPVIMEEHTRYIMDIIHNATWSDGVPLTANDVAFTFLYIIESGVYGNPAYGQLDGLVATYAPSTYQVVLEFSTESYWHFSDFAYTPIIPEHIFNDMDGIGYKNWEFWDPIKNPDDPFVTCGPFLFNNCVPGISYELVRNPLFYYGVEEPNITDTTTTTTTTTEIMDYGTLAISLTISSISGFVIVVFSYRSYLEIEKNRPKLREIPWEEVSEGIGNHREED
ncbi:MAG: hypothetical protein JW779_11680 [Candidatus Thorarchaeota archaeon]|nr:hypothetical protein [Candidatus Thorarchaeota archaeon]